MTLCTTPTIRTSTIQLGCDEPQSPGGVGDDISCSLQVSCSNQYEAIVTPDEHSVVDDPLLFRTPYIINTEYMALICIHCKHSVNPNSAYTHAKRIHPYLNVPKTFTTELDAMYPGLATNKIHPAAIIPPVFGLAIPEEKYVVCARCLQGYLNIRSWRNHTCEKAEIDLNGQPLHFLSLVQTFFREPKLCYFPVETPLLRGTDANVDHFELFKSQFVALQTADELEPDPLEYRELDQFLLKEGWLAHVAGFSRTELSNLTQIPQLGEHLEAVTREMFVLMSKIQSIIGNAGIYVRRLLGKRPS